MPVRGAFIALLPEGFSFFLFYHNFTPLSTPSPKFLVKNGTKDTFSKRDCVFIRKSRLFCFDFSISEISKILLCFSAASFAVFYYTLRL